MLDGPEGYASGGRLKMKYEPSYDGLRACAVAGVIAVHVGVPLPGGGTGVEVFFALSGFLITRILLDEEEKTGGVNLKRFYKRRVLRLAPALLSVLLVVTAYAWAIGNFREQAFSSITALLYLMNFNRAFEWGSQVRLGHTWSLSMEEQFYFIWPFVLLLIPKGLRLKVTLFLIISVCLWRGWLLISGAGVERVYNGLDTHSEVLLMGCIAAMVGRGASNQVKLNLIRFAYVPIAFLAWEVFYLNAASALGQGIGTIGIGVMSCWLILALPDLVWLRAPLSLPVFVYLGRISYALYLWHFPILHIGRELGLPHWGKFTPVVSLIVAAASYRWLEAPFLRLKERGAGSTINEPALPSAS